jgi:ligand-binding sensor domain-containing protein
MKRILINFLFFVIPFIPLALISQNPEWINYTNGDNITDIAIEGDIVWVGTTGGLVRIDKATDITIFYNKANSDLPSNDITCIAIDENGNKWIGTSGAGLAKFDNTDWTIYNGANTGWPDNITHYNNIFCIASDHNGKIWVIG